jgi:hypothetical protein
VYPDRKMNKVIRNIIIAILIGIVIVLILYAFGDSKYNSPSSSPSTPIQIPGMKLSTPVYPMSRSSTHQLSTREGFADGTSNVSDSDMQVILKLVRMVGASKISDTDTTGWVKTLSGQTQTVTNPMTDFRATIGYSSDDKNSEFSRNIEIIPGVVGYQFERIRDIPQPTFLVPDSTTVPTTMTSTAGTTTTSTAGTTTTSTAGTTTTSTAGTTTTSTAGTTTTVPHTKSDSVNSFPTDFSIDTVKNNSPINGTYYIKIYDNIFMYLYYDPSKNIIQFTTDNSKKTKFDIVSKKYIYANEIITIKINGTNKYLKINPNTKNLIQYDYTGTDQDNEPDDPYWLYYKQNENNNNEIIIGREIINNPKVPKGVIYYCGYNLLNGDKQLNCSNIWNPSSDTSDLYLILERVQNFTNISEKFTNLPTTVEYQKLLLKLANKSKSGVPNPYYFNPSAGFKFNIIFNNTPGLTNSTLAKCDAVITSIADGHQITFDKCNFVYSSTVPNKIQLSFVKESKPDPLQVSTADFGQIASGILVSQKFDLQLECKPSISGSNIGTEITDYTGQDRTKFLKLINSQVVIPVSKLTYTLHISVPEINAEQDILSYEINMASIMARHENMQEYTYKKMGALTEELLNEKVGNIVTPMFVLDNKLNTMENKLKNVNDAYFFNNLNNGQTNYRFFNTN